MKENTTDLMFTSIKRTLDVIQDEQRNHRALTMKILEKVGIIEDDIKDTKRTQSSLVQSQASTDRITTDHEVRLTKIEGHLELV